MSYPTFVPTRYKISTITATGSVNTDVSLDVLFGNVDIALPSVDDQEPMGIVYAEYGSKKTKTIHKGFVKKRSVTHRDGTEKKRFDNQVTLVYKFANDVTVNIKVFKNGHIQMTGVRYIDQGSVVIDSIITLLQGIYKIDPAIVGDYELMQNVDFRIRLINCDFRIGFEIKRDKLHRVMLSDYDVYSSYEPCIYPGLKIQYWYNTDHVVNNDGCCKCVDKCNGKGIGTGDGQCKKITIAVFQSGCIIITGGQSIAQINEAYDYICDVIRNNIGSIYKVAMPPLIQEPKKKKIYIKKSSIRTIA